MRLKRLPPSSTGKEEAMKDPILKRIPRELKGDPGKYIALFLFLTLTIGFVSGFLVAGGSMKQAYDDSFEKYSIENGHFTTMFPADEELLSDVEKEQDITIYELYSKDKTDSKDRSVRLFKPRSEVNRIDVMKGSAPVNDSEIIIDRLFAVNNSIKVGDTYTIGDTDFTVSGFAAFSDYSALYKNNTDMMFDATNFNVAMVTDSAWDSFSDVGLNYTYCWLDKNTDPDDEKAQKDKGEAIMKQLAAGTVLTDFVIRPDNQAIMFAGDDVGKDKVMMQVMLYIIIAVMAFIFAVTTRSTIEQEASVIGTLRASGYTRGELLRHYVALPVVLTLIAAIVGNILGYTCFKQIVADVYYHSYSLPTYTTIWNAEAFILTTVVPCILILLINILVISASLRISPLRFLRHDLGRSGKRSAVKLPDWKFMHRFRIRVILQNIPAYLVMFVGIFLASVLLMFGLMMKPLLINYKDSVTDSEISKYQYILKTPTETETEGAEKYSVSSLQNDSDETVTVYGISEDSDYLSVDSSKVYLSDGYMEKYGVKSGDTLTLHDKYSGKEYKFTIDEKYHYPATMCIMVSRSSFNEMFGNEADYFNGWFSDKEITDIDEMLIATVITESDLTVVANQLDDSMSGLFNLFWIFAVILYILVIYLLAKMIIEKNASSISMVKILGCTNAEASGLYTSATAIVVAVSLLLCLPLGNIVIKKIYYAMMVNIPGWLTYYIAPWIYPAMFGIGAACYLVVTLIQLKKIRSIPLSTALKNME